MPFCAYKVRSLEGEEQKGECWCSNKSDLSMSFRNKGFYVIQYKELNNKKLSFMPSNLSLKELTLLCSNFASLISAGLNMLDIILILKDDFKNKALNGSLKEIEQSIYQGEELSYCMSKNLSLYPSLLINMVRVGEESGKLDQVFKILSQYYENEKKIKDKIIKVMTYPCIVLVVSLLMMAFMVTTIIPMLVSSLDGMSVKLPLTTKIIINFNYFFKENYLFFLIIILFLLAGLFHIRNLEKTSIIVDKLKVNNVITKNLYIKLISVRFSRTLGILLESGIHISKALDITLGVIDNKFVKKEVERCIEEVKRGESISSSIDKIKFFPRNLISMTKIGEETGCLDEMLLKVSNIIEEDLYVSIDKLTVFIEPALILGLSFIIGFMMISVLMPMMNLMDSI